MFVNFNSVGKSLGLFPEMVLMVLASKHWGSVLDYAKDLEKGKKRERTEPIEAKIDDLIVYLCLLKAMIEARQLDQKVVEIRATSVV